jgi:hypothetical protein
MFLMRQKRLNFTMTDYKTGYKVKNKYNIVGTVPKSNRKIVETGSRYPNIYIVYT